MSDNSDHELLYSNSVGKRGAREVFEQIIEEKVDLFSVIAKSFCNKEGLLDDCVYLFHSMESRCFCSSTCSAFGWKNAVMQCFSLRQKALSSHVSKGVLYNWNINSIYYGNG